MQHFWLWLKQKLLGQGRIRVTGDVPSLQLQRQYANWENCFDEEGQEGQDETTLRPCKNQRVLEPDTFTAGEIHFASGNTVPVFIALRRLQLDYVTAFPSRSTTECWSIYPSAKTREWSTDCLRSFEGARIGEISAPIDDKSLFPLRISTRLPLEETGKPLSVTVTRVKRLPDPIPKGS